MIRTVFRTALHKLCAAFGGVLNIPLVYGLFAVCFVATSVILSAGAPDKVAVALVDECGGTYSSRLCSALLSDEHLDVTVFSSRREAENALLDGTCEACLTVASDYDDGILSDTSSPLVSITEAPDAVSGDLLRETAAGLLMAGRSAARMERTLNAEGYDGALLYTFADSFDHANMYSVRTVRASQQEDRAAFGQGYACYEGVAALSLFLLLFTLAVRLSNPAAKQVLLRLAAHPNGKTIGFFGDLAALIFAGLLLTVPAFLFAPDRSWLSIALLLCYTVCICGVCLFLSRFSVPGRIDLLGPFIALVTSIVGGCFTDLSALGGACRVLSLLTPQGQLIAAFRGKPLFALLLLAEGILWTALSAACRTDANAARVKVFHKRRTLP